MFRRCGEAQDFPSQRVDAYRLQLDGFAAAVRGLWAPGLGRRDAIAQAAAIEALYASADRGRPVTLSAGESR